MTAADWQKLSRASQWLGTTFSLLVLMVLTAPRAAFAYVDPGAGSAAYQLVLAVALGMGFVVRRVTTEVLARLKAHAPRPAPAASKLVGRGRA